MLSNQYFNIDRFLQVLRRDLSRGGRITWIVVGSMAGLMLLVGLSDPDDDFHEYMYPSLLLLGGFILTSISFNEMINPESRQFYLSLPASNLEKFLSRWLISWIGYAVIVTLGYWVMTLLIMGLTQFFHDYTFPPFNLFEEENWMYFKIYLVVQSIFLLGAVAFRKFAFFKTVLAFYAILLVFAFACFIVFKLVLIDYQEGFFEGDLRSSEGHRMTVTKDFQNFVEKPLATILEYCFWFLLAPALWVAAYFKWTEQEM